MHEKISVPTMHEMLNNIDPRVLLDLTLKFDEDPESLEQQAAAAIKEEKIPPEVLVPLQTFVNSERRKRIHPRSRQEIQRSVASVVLAHLWQAENDTAREQHKKLPH